MIAAIQEQRPRVARLYRFSEKPGNLDLYMKPNFNMLAHFFKRCDMTPTKIHVGVTFGHFEIFFFPKKFLNSLISFLSEDRKVWGIFQQHCEVRLEYKVTELLLDWVLDEDHFYSTIDTIQDAEVIAVNRTNSSHGCLLVLYPKWDTQ